AAWLWPGRLGGPRAPAQVRAIVRRDVEHWKRHGWGPWIVRDRRSGELLGRVGLSAGAVTAFGEAEAAWLLAPHRWGEGLATEMAGAALHRGFGELALDDVVALALPHNVASRRVMERLGFGYEGEVVHAGLTHVLYRLRNPSARRR